MKRSTILAMLAMLAMLASACGSNAEQTPLAIVANAHQAGTLAVGTQRVLVGIAEQDGLGFLGGEDVPVEFDFFYGDDPNQEGQTVKGSFVWTVPEVRGLYRTTVTFDRPGTWGLVARLSGQPASGVTLFSVVSESPVPDVGDSAPEAVTPTGTEFALEDISSDSAPDPRFYELSLDEAIRSGKPTVVVFATPAFCTSATCGPTLDVVKSLAGGYPGVNFVHVEVFTNLTAQNPDDLQVVPAVEAWRLPSEPWVFVIDEAGYVSERFEGTLAPEELQAALDR